MLFASVNIYIKTPDLSIIKYLRNINKYNLRTNNNTNKGCLNVYNFIKI